ncbi:uracil-DNA glycosylase [soil metagenome]
MSRGLRAKCNRQKALAICCWLLRLLLESMLPNRHHFAMTGKHSIASLIALLAATPSTETVFNPYDASTDCGATCRCNLSLYLNELLCRQTTTLLLGEAPGYQGCRLTGIPFTSEHILLNGVPSLGMLGVAKGYRRSTTGDRLKKEPSATIVWQALELFQFLPLLWPAFPYHPHKPGNGQSNRVPTSKEIAFGRPVWQQLVEIMGIEQIVAIGNVAHGSLAAAGIEAKKIRHPSQGGKPQFVEGIRLLALNQSHQSIDVEPHLPDAGIDSLTQ